MPGKIARKRGNPQSEAIPGVYMMALLLVLALFYLHALLLLDVAGLMVKDRAPLIEIIGPGHAGKALIIWSFVVLFVAHVLEAAAWGLLMRWRRLCTNFPEGLYSPSLR
jgi:hypothetical protein